MVGKLILIISLIWAVVLIWELYPPNQYNFIIQVTPTPIPFEYDIETSREEFDRLYLLHLYLTGKLWSA